MNYRLKEKGRLQPNEKVEILRKEKEEKEKALLTFKP